MYEHKTYVEARRRFPREGKILRTYLGEEKVVSVEILQETVTLRSAEGERRTVSLEELKSEVSATPPTTPT
jgi:cell fate regulator YaaT (PSP1 superfamily)